MLNRTRESLASDTRLDRSGHLLDQALAKQIAVREAELDSFSKPNKNVSVIVRCSTPDPEAECREEFPHTHPHALTPQAIPVDRSLPLNYLLHSLENLDQPPLPPRHPVSQLRAGHAGGAPLNSSAPAVPWTPPRSSPSGPLLGLLSSPRSSSLLAPLITVEAFDISNPKGSRMDLVQTKEDCEAKKRKFNGLLRVFDPAPKSLGALKRSHSKYHDDLLDALNTLVEVIENMCVKHGQVLGTQTVTSWKEEITRSEADFHDWSNRVDEKLGEYASGPPAHSVAIPTSDHTNANRVKMAEADTKVDAEIIGAEAKELSKEIDKFADWGEASNDQIETAMNHIDDWKKRFNRVKEKLFSIKRNVLKYDLADTQLKISTALINTLESELCLAVDTIRFEDEQRCLYSNSRSKGAEVKLPTFDGNRFDDFMKFQKEMKKGFKSNKIRKEDQVKKLRECLRGDPKELIPVGMESVEDAWLILKTRYGDAARVMTAKKMLVEKMGKYPKAGFGAVGLSRQIKWITELETILLDIIRLGEESEQLERDAYSSDMVLLILGYFPYHLQYELQDVLLPAEEDAKKKLCLVIEFLKKLRLKNQGLEKVAEHSETRKPAEGSRKVVDEESEGSSGRGGKFGYGKGGKTLKWSPVGAVVYNPPERDEKCRICTQLEAEGDTKNIYDDHTQSVPVGCPRFAAMPQKEKLSMIKKAKLCNFCMDSTAIVKQGVLHAKCPVLQSKKFYTCLGDNCKVHFSLCDNKEHIKLNKKKFEAARTWWEKKGIKYANIAYMSRPTCNEVAQVTTAEQLSGPQVQTGEELPEPDVPEGRDESNREAFDTQVKTKADDHPVNLREATKKLKECVEGSTVIEVPEGDPMFLFSSAVGKTRAINIFYDKGCSHVVLKDGVPQEELDSVMTKQGPLSINGVGDTKVRVKDEWACLLDKADGCKQIIQGVTVDHITAPFPIMDLKEAVKEIKADDPENEELQDLRVPSTAGGEADILFGILYECCHPVHVHTLPSGLFIAKLRLATPGNQWTGVIGGPHKSFERLSEQAGDVSRLMAHFVDGLKDYESLGAPVLHAPMMTWEDVQFAHKMNRAEVEDYTEESQEAFEDNLEAVEVEEGLDVNSDGIVCDSCGENLEETEGLVDDITNHRALFSDDLETDEKLKELKIFVKMQELGLSIDYRCPACRSCHGCKNAPDTERISLREEAEDQAIRESVNIDFEKKKITCVLPLRGKEEEFLCNNRAIAERVLDSQCKKVQNDEEARNTVIKSFYKLFDGGFARRFDELDESQKQVILKKKVQHYLPWRVVYKASLSTPCRTVMDASSRTPLLENGQGGRCLNDATMKGRVDTLNLLNMLLRFSIGQVAFTGDLKQFYPSIALDQSQWNLQRVLWREGMSFDSPIEEIIIMALIFGVRAVSALSEKALTMLAESVGDKFPRLAELLSKDRFVDDIGSSDFSKEIVTDIIAAADKLFESVGLTVKAWSVSGAVPHPDVSADGVSVDIGGMTWYPVIDSLSIKIPPLHFGKKSRGKLVVGTEVFDGNLADLKKFVKPLTRRQIVSKFSALFDMYGKLTPLTAKMKLDVSKAVKETSGWDEKVSVPLHDKWIDNFWTMHKLRGLQFQRARVPSDAFDTKVYLSGCVDAADSLKIVGVWARFKRKNGKFSCQLIIGRSLLSKGGTIPKEELEAATIGSNLLFIVRRALDGWVEDYSLFGDSSITICWITSENKRLSLYHRNRVVQVRFHTELEKIFHVRTEHNPADIGTRPDKTSDEDVGPESIWERGLPWMKGSMEDALEKDIIKHAGNLRLNDNEKEEYNRGLIFEKCPQILIKGHGAFATNRIQKMASRAEFSKYLFMPTKFNFRKVVRVTACMFKYLKKAGLVKTTKNRFRMFVAQKAESLVRHFVKEDQFMGICWGAEKPLASFIGDAELDIDDEDISLALEYWYKKGSKEVVQFNKKEMVAKVAVEKESILYCRSRIMDGQRFISAGGFEKNSLGLEVQLNMMTPLLDRYSPIAYSVANYVHHELGKHAGYETCFRISLGYCHVIQGVSLFREISDECAKCSMIRRKYIEVIMGPVSDHQLTISPPFYAAFCDLDGPYDIFVPGHERETRSKKVLSAKAYIMSFACPVTKLLNLQVIESKSADGVLEGLTRLGCEQGFPKYLLLDQESSFMKAVKQAEINLKDLKLRSYKEQGVLCEIAPVSGHNFTGLIERKIRTVQEAFDKIGLKKMRLHATGLQTIAKLTENNLNNLPIGFSYDRSLDNTPLLKLITPNMMRIGRLNSRALDGPVRFPTGPKDMMKKVEETYEAFFKIWNLSMIPKLIPQPKWFKESPELKIEDIVYFQKTESELSSDWSVGQVDSVIRSRDGVVRRANVRYFNHSEKEPRFSDRAVRSLVRLFNIEDNYFISDMAEVEAMMFDLQKKTEEEMQKVEPMKLIKNKDGDYRVKTKDDGPRKSCGCCCLSHCNQSVHNLSGNLMGVSMAARFQELDAFDMSIYEFPHIYEKDLEDGDVVEFDEPIQSSLVVDRKDDIYDMLTALETDFRL